jgi:single-strand DNA-binding protein
MSDINTVILTGRVTRDSELKYTSKTNTPVLSFGIASNRVWFKDTDRQEETTFVDVTVWGKKSESYVEHLKKGRKVSIEGRLKLDRWEVEGVNRTKLSVIAEKINFLEPLIKKNGNSTEAVAVPFDAEEPQVEFNEDF